MSKKKLLKHGFKADCERQAIAFRKELGILSHGKICAFELAGHLNIAVYDATEIVSSTEDIRVLKGENNNGKSEWHALTMKTKVGNTIIIYNPFNSIARQQSDVMHELSHIILKHKRVESNNKISIPFGLREFDAVQEEEAKELGGILQLPRESLVWAKEQGFSIEEIANHFNASIDMVRFRLNKSGVNKQFYYRKKYY